MTLKQLRKDKGLTQEQCSKFLIFQLELIKDMNQMKKM